MNPIRRLVNLLSKWFDVINESIDTGPYQDRIERKFEVVLDPAQTVHLNTLGDLQNYILRSREVQGQSIDPEKIWPPIRKTTSEELGVAESELTLQIRFREDLNC